ncbi:MAG: class I SAM-dependent methyltransferase [Candidatus Aureabacteria bacterium]|jgi:SAM-dependent methyltransferase|nr:class I SAM-dependent methyltransferase [Candidatus Auribacterota bacterium]
MSGHGGLPALRDILALYPGLTPVRKALLATRFFLIPFRCLHERIPADAIVFEMGCGQGVLANFLKEAAPDRIVVGMDLSPARIEIACTSMGGRRGIYFVVGDVTRSPFSPLPHDGDRPWAYITAEVLYLLPVERAVETMRAIGERLRARDSYWIVDFCGGAGVRSLFLAMESSLLSLVVKMGRRIPRMGRTATEAFGERARRARVPRYDEWRRILARAGLAGEQVSTGMRTPFPQIMFRCTRASGGESAGREAHRPRA